MMRPHHSSRFGSSHHVCGCYIFHFETQKRTYLPQVKLEAHTTILSTAARTTLTHTFVNSSKESLDEIRYAFPLFDGVSVVDFFCQIGERTIYGLVKEKNEARKTYEEAKERGESAALLEQLPNAADVFTTAISNISKGASRALMTTLVPKFNLQSQKPEIIFIADRSGSMGGQIPTLVSALKVFLKSIPIGCMFNICSFGSSYTFLWEQSQLYGQVTLKEAIRHVEAFSADFGRTETLEAVKACFEARNTDLPTELMLLTDGDIWAQDQLFDYVSENTKSGDVRVFPIGIGGGVSSALIEGVARAGRGFSQMVAENEKLDSRIVRMLKGALTPHIQDYRLEVKYEDDSVESVADSLRINLNLDDNKGEQKKAAVADKQPISLYNPDVVEEHPKDSESKYIFAGLPELKRPTLLQTPHEIPSLFPFNRTCVYLMMSPESSHLQPKSVVLKGTSPQGPLELEIPVEVRKEADEMIHQLAARKATQELEEGHGWLSEATIGDTGVLVKEKHRAQYALLQRREAVRLGVEFQVGGKYCSFVAVEANEADIAEKRKTVLEATITRADIADEDDWEILDDEDLQARRANFLYSYRPTASYDLNTRTGGSRRKGPSGIAPCAGSGGRGGGCGGGSGRGGGRGGYPQD